MTGVGEGEQPDQNLLHNDPTELLTPRVSHLAFPFRVNPNGRRGTGAGIPAHFCPRE